jgi:hypothetical protein
MDYQESHLIVGLGDGISGCSDGEGCGDEGYAIVEYLSRVGSYDCCGNGDGYGCGKNYQSGDGYSSVKQ